MVTTLYLVWFIGVCVSAAMSIVYPPDEFDPRTGERLDPAIRLLSVIVMCLGWFWFFPPAILDWLNREEDEDE
jgi:hypothetical protein